MQALLPNLVIIILTVFFNQGLCARVVEHIGSDAIAKFSTDLDRESAGVLSPIQVLPGVPSGRHCLLTCVKRHHCLSFNFKAKVGACELFDDIDPVPDPVSGVQYGVALNRKGISFDCVETWAPWSSAPMSDISDMWEYCGLSPSSKVDCADACTETSARASMDPPAYGGADCYPSNIRQRNDTVCANETTRSMHVLLIGGYSNGGVILKTILDFKPETKQIITLQQQLVQRRQLATAVLYQDRIIVDGGYDSGIVMSSAEFFVGVPLQHQSISAYTTQTHHGGCSHIWNDKLYYCFGGANAGNSALFSHCDVYDLTNNYAYSTLPTQVPAVMYAACVQSNQYLYVIAGYTVTGNTDQVYKMDLTDGTKSDLTPFHNGIHSLSAVWYGGNIVACGGIIPGGLKTSICKEYTIGIGWAPFPPMPVARSHYHMVNFGAGKILAIGGLTEIAIDLYDGAMGNWAHYANLPYQLKNPACVVINA